MFPNNLSISSVGYLHHITCLFLEHLAFVLDAFLLLDSARYTRKSYLETKKKKGFVSSSEEKNRIK